MEFGLEAIFHYGSLGMNKRQIGDLYGYTEHAVGKRLKRAGRLEEFNKISKFAAEEGLYQEVIKLKKAGLSVKIISKRLSRNEYQIASILNQAVSRLDVQKGVCLFCQEEHDYSYSRGRYCSEYCARCYSTKDISAESRQKQIDTLRSLHRFSIKENGERVAKPLKLHKKYRRNYEPNMDLRRKRTSLKRSAASKATVQKRIDDGTHSGWTSRNVRSYPEKYWVSVFENHGIPFIEELPVSKRSLGIDEPYSYFLDFVIVAPNGAMIDIEIDGKQHKYPERAASDKIRDERLTRGNFIVYRIPWVNPAHKKDVTHGQIKDLLDFLYKHGVYSG